jgi:hypothetical protein
MSHHVLFGDPGLRAAFTQNGGTGGSFPDDDPVTVFGSVEFNGVDGELLTLNALPSGECHVAMWLKWSALVTGFRVVWETSDGLGTNNRVGGGKAADNVGGGGPSSYKGTLWPPAGIAYSDAQHPPPYAWELWIWTRAATTDYWTLDAPSDRIEWASAYDTPVGADQMSFGYSSGGTAPYYCGGKIARMWITSGAGSFVDAATAATWRADSTAAVVADHEWRPGAPGDTTSLIQDHVGSWDLTGSGGLTLGTDKP